MKTSRGSTSLDKKLTGQYRRLFRNLGLLMLVIIALATASVVYFDKRQVEELSRKLIISTTATIVEQTMSFSRQQKVTCHLKLHGLLEFFGLLKMTQWSPQVIDPYVNKNIIFGSSFKYWNAVDTGFC